MRIGYAKSKAFNTPTATECKRGKSLNRCLTTRAAGASAGIGTDAMASFRLSTRRPGRVGTCLLLFLLISFSSPAVQLKNVLDHRTRDGRLRLAKGRDWGTALIKCIFTPSCHHLLRPRRLPRACCLATRALAPALPLHRPCRSQPVRRGPCVARP